MDFRNLLVSQRPPHCWQSLTGFPRDLFRLYAPLDFGDGHGVECEPHYVLSIQASQLHHCAPPLELEDAFEYESFEVCLTEFVSGKEHLVNPATDPQFRHYGWCRYWKHDKGFISGIYISTADVQQIVDDLEELVADLSSNNLW
jgi:hypothetical protein